MSETLRMYKLEQIFVKMKCTFRHDTWRSLTIAAIGMSKVTILTCRYIELSTYQDDSGVHLPACEKPPLSLETHVA